MATGTNYTGADGVAQSSIVISQGAASTPSISNMPAPLTGAVGGGFTATVSTTGDGTKTVTSSTSLVCTTSGLVVTYVGPGSCVLTVDVATGTNYTGADGVAQSSIVISQGAASTPSISNMPAPLTGAVGGGFTATVSTTGDGTKTVTSSTSLVCTTSTLVVTYVGPGSCVLTADVATGTNYTGADGVAQSSIVISQGAASTPSISNMPAPLTGAVGGGFTATVSTTGDGTKTVTSSTSLVCTTSGLVVTYVGPGSCVLTADVATGTNYTGADGVAQSSIVISQGAASTPSISNMPAPLTGAVGGGFTATVSTTGDGTKTVTSSTSLVCTTSGLVVTYVGPGSCVLTAHVATGTNYTGADGVAQSSIVISQGFVAPPTGPTNAPPPTNPSVPASSFGTPTSVTASCAATTTVSETSGGANETITVPQCALPSGTTLSAYPVINTAPLVAQVPAGSSYVLSFAVTWEAPNGTSPTATAPITMTITDLSIVAGDTIYELTSTGLVAVGTATANGTVTITFSSDPTFLVSHTTPVAQAPLRITTLSGTVGTALHPRDEGWFR